MFVDGNHLQPSLAFANKTLARVTRFRVLLALPEITRLGSLNPQETNDLAYSWETLIAKLFFSRLSTGSQLNLFLVNFLSVIPAAAAPYHFNSEVFLDKRMSFCIIELKHAQLRLSVFRSCREHLR